MAVCEQQPVDTSTARAPLRRGLWLRALLIVMPAVLVLALNGYTREFYTWDEAYNILMGRNMAESWEGVVRPTWIPGETRDWQSYAFDVLAFPPLVSAIYGLIGTAAHEAWAALDVFAAAVFAFYLWLAYRCVARFNETAGLLTLCAMAASWPLLAQMRALEAEPVVALFGVTALYAYEGIGKETAKSPKRWLCFVAGTLAGMGYLAKLWLAAPCVLAIGGIGVARALSGRQWRHEAARAAIAALGFLAAASAHLAFVCVTSPGDLPLWVQAVYFGTFTGMGVGGIKVTGAAIAPGWAHPIWYYPAILFRDHYFLVPLFVAGIPAMLCETDRRTATVFWGMIGGGIVALAALSLPGVKEPLYILPCLFFFYAGAAYSLAAFVNAPRTRTFPLLAIAFCAATALAVTAAWTMGIKSDDITPGYVLRHVATMAGVATVLGLAMARRPHAALRACITLALLGLAANAIPLLHPKANLDVAVADAIREEMAAEGKASYSIILQVQATPQITPSDFALQLLLYPNRCHRDEEAYSAQEWARLLDAADIFILLPQHARNETHAACFENVRQTGKPLAPGPGFNAYIKR